MANVTNEMVFFRMEDIGAYAEVRNLVRLTKEIVAATPGGAHDRSFLALKETAETTAAILLDGLQAKEPVVEVRRLREVTIMLIALRDQTWELHAAGLLAAYFFDEIMHTSARCRRETVQLEKNARHRGRRMLDG
jgi:hypothetical protein